MPQARNTSLMVKGMKEEKEIGRMKPLPARPSQPTVAPAGTRPILQGFMARDAGSVIMLMEKAKGKSVRNLYCIPRNWHKGFGTPTKG